VNCEALLLTVYTDTFIQPEIYFNFVNKDGLQYISGDNIGYKIPESLRLTFNYIISANTYFALKSMQNQ
jgi:hypothetical protein